MIISKKLRPYTLACLIFCGLILPKYSNAQCPSVMGSGDPAVILLNIYAIPNVQYFTPDQEEMQFGLTPGIQIGAILSDKFHVVSGVEMSWIKRTVEWGDSLGGTYNYRTRFLEIPIDMRMRIAHTRKDEAFFILGAGFVMSNVISTNDPDIARDETLYHQMFIRMGFEHVITVKKTFNILWGMLGKADPFAIADQSHSFQNGTYFGGLKLGVQFGL